MPCHLAAAAGNEIGKALLGRFRKCIWKNANAAPGKWTRLVGKEGRGAVVIATSLVAFTTFNFHNDYDMQYMAVHMCECVCVCDWVCVCVCGGSLRHPDSAVIWRLTKSF